MLADAFDPAGYDVVHAQDCISANAVGSCIRTVHHIDHFSTPELAACHERAIVDPYAHICVSAAVAGELLNGWGIAAEVIPNGVDAQRFSDAAGPAGAAGVFAFPSTKEGFGLAAMEALAAGVPLVVSNLPVLREIFSGVARFADDPAGLAAHLIAGLTDHNPDARKAGQALAAHYTWSATAAQHLNFYQRLR
ncbi:MAG: glycosyltransferase [Pseudonocardiaceae bacterium]